MNSKASVIEFALETFDAWQESGEPGDFLEYWMAETGYSTNDSEYIFVKILSIFLLSGFSPHWISDEVSEWRVDGSLAYCLKGGVNYGEIRVSMFEGERDTNKTKEIASLIASALNSSYS